MHDMSQNPDDESRDDEPQDDEMQDEEPARALTNEELWSMPEVIDMEQGYGPICLEGEREHPDEFYYPSGRLKYENLVRDENTDENGNRIYRDNDEAAGTPETNKFYDLRTRFPQDIVLQARLYCTRDPSLPKLQSLDGIVLDAEGTEVFRAIFAHPALYKNVAGNITVALRKLAYSRSIPGYEEYVCPRTRKDVISEAQAFARKDLEGVIERRVEQEIQWRISQAREEWEAEAAASVPADRRITYIAKTDMEALAIKMLESVKRKISADVFADGNPQHEMKFRDFYRKANFAEPDSPTPLIHIVARRGWDFVWLDFPDQTLDEAAYANTTPKVVQVQRALLQTVFTPKTPSAPASWVYDPDAPIVPDAPPSGAAKGD